MLDTDDSIFSDTNFEMKRQLSKVTGHIGPGCVRLPEWTELPEWTTGMAFYMCFLVLLMHCICIEWLTEATESRKYEYHAFY